MSMKISKFSRVIAPAVISTIALAASSSLAGPEGGAFEIVWYTIDAGGTSSTFGGVFDLAGTIGQPDAGTEMTGGSFTLTGGFWAGVNSSPPCPPDLTGDGALNFFDISAFLTAFAAMDPVADFNNDGAFNFFDISEFLAAFSAGCP